MAITRARVNEADAFGRRKHGLPYEYGGDGDGPMGSSSGDCSWAVAAMAAILHGKTPATRYGSTETWRLARANGIPAPLGTLPASSAAAVPKDAGLKIGFQHGGGGMNSHTACTLNLGGGREMSFESRGWPGVLYGPGSTAKNPPGNLPRAWNSALFHDFWFVPGPILDGPVDPTAFPLPAGYYFGPYEGPEESISGRANEPAEWVDGLRRWQKAAGVPADGIYGEATRKRAIDYQIPAGLLPDGKIGPRTWALAFKDPKVNEFDQLYSRITEFIKGYVGPIGEDVKVTREQITGSRDTHYLPDGSIDLARSYPGHDFLGGGTAVDALGRIGAAQNLPGFRDPKPSR